MNQIFAISTPSPLKLGSKLSNITKIAIFTNIDVKELVNYDIGEGDRATGEALAEDGKSVAKTIIFNISSGFLKGSTGEALVGYILI